MSEQDDEQVMTIGEVAHYLRVSDTTVYRLVKKGDLPGRKIGGQWRVWRRSLETYLAQDLTDKDASDASWASVGAQEIESNA